MANLSFFPIVDNPRLFIAASDRMRSDCSVHPSISSSSNFLAISSSLNRAFAQALTRWTSQSEKQWNNSEKNKNWAEGVAWSESKIVLVGTCLSDLLFQPPRLQFFFAALEIEVDCFHCHLLINMKNNQRTKENKNWEVGVTSSESKTILAGIDLPLGFSLWTTTLAFLFRGTWDCGGLLSFSSSDNVLQDESKSELSSSLTGEEITGTNPERNTLPLTAAISNPRPTTHFPRYLASRGSLWLAYNKCYCV